MLESSVTAIVVNWNGGNLLTECLSRLTAQSVTPSRILVMDNSSNDGSAEKGGPVSRGRYLLSGCESWFTAGNNFTLDECETEFVALLNPDALPEPDW